MRFSLPLLLVLALPLALGLAACGDDDGADGGLDAGPTDAGTDGGSRDGGTDGGGMDAGMDGGSVDLPLTECDIFDPTSCGEGTTCKIVIYSPDAETIDPILFYGCVDDAIARRAGGILCDRTNELSPSNPDDTFFTDDCGEGLFCWTSLDDRFERCRPLCGDDRVECDTDEFCLTLNSEPPFGLCNPASPCDPVFQSGCPDDEACFVVRNTFDDLVGRCLTPGAVGMDGGMPPMVGDPCMTLDACPRGSQCIPEILPDGGMGMSAECRAFCAAGPGADGGVADMDGGVPMFTGECPSSETCVEIPLDMGTSRVPTPTGVCQ